MWGIVPNGEGEFSTWMLWQRECGFSSASLDKTEVWYQGCSDLFLEAQSAHFSVEEKEG